MAIADGNKMTIHDEGGLALFLELLESGSLPEKEEACKGLWTLCFDEHIASQVSKDTKIIEGRSSAYIG